MPGVLKLFPPPQESHPLEGLYLAHDLRSHEVRDRPFVYSNFVTSLDGRIAVADANCGLGVPKAIANNRDWRLFQELAVQADVLFTSGRYLREYKKGESQEILQVYDDPRFEDLGAWRTGRGLPAYPALAVVSASGDFPIPDALRSGDRRLHVVTTRAVAPARLRELERHAEVHIAGEHGVDGADMVRQMAEAGYRLMGNVTGPQILHLLVAARVLDRLYLTGTGRLLGGDPYATIIEGERLEPPVDFRLARLYYDPEGPDGLGQVFQVYDKNLQG